MAVKFEGRCTNPVINLGLTANPDQVTLPARHRVRQRQRPRPSLQERANAYASPGTRRGAASIQQT